jgi:hypothetical protein
MARKLPVLAADPLADAANPTRVAGILRCGVRGRWPGRGRPDAGPRPSGRPKLVRDTIPGPA